MSDHDFVWELLNFAVIFTVLGYIVGIGILLTLSSDKTSQAICSAIFIIIGLPIVIIIAYLTPELTFITGYLSFSTMLAIIIRQFTPHISITKFSIVSVITIIMLPLLVAFMNGNSYSDKEYIETAYFAFNIPVPEKPQGYVEQYYDNINYCDRIYKDNGHFVNFFIMRLFGQQKNLVIIGEHFILFNRFGQPIKKKGHSLPTDNCGG